MKNDKNKNHSLQKESGEKHGDEVLMEYRESMKKREKLSKNVVKDKGIQNEREIERERLS